MVNKTALLVISVLILSSVPAGAQDYRHEVSGFVGAGSLQDIGESFASAFVLIYSMGYIQEDTKTSTPVLGLNYRYHLSRLFSVGGTFNYQQFKNRYSLLGTEFLETTTKYITVMGRFDITYLRFELFQMYSGAAVGICHQNEGGSGLDSHNTTAIGFQVNLVGLRIGKQLAGILELGLGCNGIAVAGMTYAF